MSSVAPVSVNAAQREPFTQLARRPETSNERNIAMSWQMTCPRCGTWKQWRRHDICSTCGAKTDVVELHDGEPTLPMLQVHKRNLVIEDSSKAVVVEQDARE